MPFCLAKKSCRLAGAKPDVVVSVRGRIVDVQREDSAVAIEVTATDRGTRSECNHVPLLIVAMPGRMQDEACASSCFHPSTQQFTNFV